MKNLGYCGIHLLNIRKPKKWKNTDVFFIEDYLVKSTAETVKISTLSYMSMNCIIEVVSW